MKSFVANLDKSNYILTLDINHGLVGGCNRIEEMAHFARIIPLPIVRDQKAARRIMSLPYQRKVDQGTRTPPLWLFRDSSKSAHSTDKLGL